MVPEASTALPGLSDVLQPGGASPLLGSAAATQERAVFLCPWSLRFALKGAISKALAHIFILWPVPVKTTELEADSVTSTYSPV